jgi:hypothetical protein
LTIPKKKWLTPSEAVGLLALRSAAGRAVIDLPIVANPRHQFAKALGERCERLRLAWVAGRLKVHLEEADGTLRLLDAHLAEKWTFDPLQNGLIERRGQAAPGGPQQAPRHLAGVNLARLLGDSSELRTEYLREPPKGWGPVYILTTSFVECFALSQPSRSSRRPKRDKAKQVIRELYPSYPDGVAGIMKQTLINEVISRYGKNAPSGGTVSRALDELARIKSIKSAQ